MKRSTKSRPRRGGGATIPHPPQFDATKHVNGRARYVVVGTQTAVSITRGALLSHLIMNSASGTANYRLFSAFRLKSVEIWGAAASAAVSIEWRSANGPTVIASDTTVLSAVPAHVRTSPPKDSLAGFWSLTGTNESESLFLITSPADSIVDITYEAIVQNGESATLVTTTASGAIGTVYETYLAGATTTGFVPVSYASLT